MIKERFLSGDYQPDSYALYELRPYMPYNTSVRIMVELTEEVDGDILDVAANTAIKRYPYFSVQIERKDGKFVLAHNSRPIAVLKTQNSHARIRFGRSKWSFDVNRLCRKYHLF